MFDYILITVPHAKSSFLKFGHSWDKTAESHAKKIYSCIKRKKISGTILTGKTNRNFLDLNRRESQGSKFHQKINQIFKQEQDKKLLVLDIHSGNDQEIFGDNPFILLDYANSNRDDKIIKILNETFHISLKHKGTIENYILKKTFEAGFTGLLFEFNEKFKAPYPSKFYDKLIDCF